MGCIYISTWIGEDAGTCSMWDEDIEMNGCDEQGNCVCSDDPDPGHMCETYESDNECADCGVDLNIGDCECEEE